MRRVVISIIFLLSISNIVNAQNKNAGYIGGNDSLVRRVTKYLMKVENVFEWGDSDSYVIAFLEVNEMGKVKNLTLTSIMDTICTNIVANAILNIKDNWINNSGRSQFFEIPFYFQSSKSGERQVLNKVPIITTTHFIDGEKVKYTRLSPIIVISYPPVR
jgi:hypothetical protein